VLRVTRYLGWDTGGHLLYTILELHHSFVSRVGILKQNAKSWYFEIPGFEVRRNSKKFFLLNYFLKTLLYASIVYVIHTAWVA
jgi:hypothetical protein